MHKSSMLAVLAILLFTPPVCAQGSKAVGGALVPAYEECTAPNTTADTSHQAACNPPVLSDPTCTFLHDGHGHVRIAGGRGRIAFALTLKGLSSGCGEGDNMGVVVRYRVTSKDCGGSACTLSDLSVGITGCHVSHGSCVFRASDPFNNLNPHNGTTTVEIRSVDVYHEGVRAFSVGAFLN